MRALIAGDELGRETFLVWYLYECGGAVPDTTAILKDCAISIVKDDDQEVVTKKLSGL